MPVALVRAFTAMLPRLRAEEQLAAIEAGQLAFGAGDEKERRAQLRALERTANGGVRVQVKPMMSNDLSAAGLGARWVGADGKEITGVRHG